jgi:hypothetical protein
MALLPSVSVAQSADIMEGSSAMKGMRERKRQGMPKLRKKLAAPVAFAGVTDPKGKLSDVLQTLAELGDVYFEVDDAAFRAEGLKDVINFPVAAKTPLLPSKDLSLNDVLRDLASRLPCRSEVKFINRGEVIQLTTHPAALAQDFREMCRRAEFDLLIWRRDAGLFLGTRP